MKWKDFLYFQSGEKIAIILLLILLVLAFSLNIFFSAKNKTEIHISTNDSLEIELKNFHERLSKKETDSVKYYPRRTEYERTYSKNNYRETERFERKSASTFRKYKLEPGEKININSKDTAEWKKVPGIGAAYAERIVKYGNMLGGYATIDQLKEVYGISGEVFSQINPFIEVDKNFTKIEINKLEFKELLKHPYLNYKQVKVISDLKKRKGNVNSLDELAMLDEFTETDLERLKPYLSFE